MYLRVDVDWFIRDIILRKFTAIPAERNTNNLLNL